jgi:hypothetical protein
LFEYSGENFSTNIPEIDNIQLLNSTNAFDFAVKDEFDKYILDEESKVVIMEGKSVDDLIVLDDSDEIQQESDTFVDFSVSDPFSENNI